MNLLLDAGILGQLCHPSAVRRTPAVTRVADLHHAGHGIYIPEASDYEVRRKLLHLVAAGGGRSLSLRYLDTLPETFYYLPLTTAMMRDAAALWADARHRGLPTAGELSFDFDVILAAQARSVGGTVVTTNAKHLGRFVDTLDREADAVPPTAGEE